MKILLVSNVERVGWFGDVVEVADGYARNYLLPQGLGVVANEANVASVAAEAAARAEQRKAASERLEEAVAEVDGAEAVVAARANEKGHLFGSVGASEIAANLAEQGFRVSESEVQLAEHIKKVGNYEVTLKFNSSLTAKVNVVVVAKQDENGQ